MRGYQGSPLLDVEIDWGIYVQVVQEYQVSQNSQNTQGLPKKKKKKKKKKTITQGLHV